MGSTSQTGVVCPFGAHAMHVLVRIARTNVSRRSWICFEEKSDSLQDQVRGTVATGVGRGGPGGLALVRVVHH